MWQFFFFVIFSRLYFTIYSVSYIYSIYIQFIYNTAMAEAVVLLH